MEAFQGILPDSLARGLIDDLNMDVSPALGLDCVS